MEKKNIEWDLNDWRWDGDMFMAAPLNSSPSDCRSKQFLAVGSDIPVANGNLNSLCSGSDKRENRDLEKRRYIEVHEEANEEGASLNLKLGGLVENEGDKWEEKSGRKTKISGSPSNRAVCQVEDCKADLSNAKDYHRRHKVCDVHSKATRALVGNVMQRFCQQCSRFHVLQEFDEGKRSCRRRLAGHNKRRRKTHPETVVSANDEQGSNHLLISLLRILSNIHSSSSDQTADQDSLSHLLRNFSSLAGLPNERNHEALPPVSLDMHNVGTSSGTAEKDSIKPEEPAESTHMASALHFLQEESSSILKQNASDTALGRVRMNNIDLNSAYDCSQDCMEDNVANENLGNASNDVPLWSCKDSERSSPPQKNRNSGSTQSRSPSTSSGEGQSRTDRIVFKLFGKDPSDFPLVLRKQILDWLSSSPADIESYIRPGCVVLTIYACMDQSSWEELYCNLNSSLRRLVESSADSFWRTGWIYTRVRHRAAFIYNGQVLLDTHLPIENHPRCRISSISPVAVSLSEAAQFVVKGFDLSPSTSRLLCALEGKYLVRENSADSFVGQHEEIQCLGFSCIIPNIVGRGFIEVEDNGLESSFFPFIVAEKDICSEICNLESIIEDTNEVEARNRALDFLHEMGWLLHKSGSMLRLGEGNSDIDLDLFPFKRFRWLIEFATDRDWCAVVNKLLSIVSDGFVDAGQYTSSLDALVDIGLLHRAVRRNSRSLVEFLLEYQLEKIGGKLKQVDEGQYLFRPDMMGPAGLTPLHIAASLDSSENVLDALTEDPGSVGIEAWKSAQDSMGLTPHDYACMRGHYPYVHLVQRKLNKKSVNRQIVMDIPGTILERSSSSKQKIEKETNQSAKSAPFQTEKARCSECERKLAYGHSPRASVTIYRPAMVSMVAIAAVCVCAALLFKSSPEVIYSFRPFRWELLQYGAE